MSASGQEIETTPKETVKIFILTVLGIKLSYIVGLLYGREIRCDGVHFPASMELGCSRPGMWIDAYEVMMALPAAVILGGVSAVFMLPLFACLFVTHFVIRVIASTVKGRLGHWALQEVSNWKYYLLFVMIYFTVLGVVSAGMRMNFG